MFNGSGSICRDLNTEIPVLFLRFLIIFIYSILGPKTLFSSKAPILRLSAEWPISSQHSMVSLEACRSGSMTACGCYCYYWLKEKAHESNHMV